MMNPEQARDAMKLALEQRKLQPAFDWFGVVEHKQATWLIGMLDASQLGKMESYTHPGTLHQMRTLLGGAPVYVSNTNKLAYAVLLSGKPSVLPDMAGLPAHEAGTFLVGVGTNGQVRTTWNDAGHILVVGMTRFGKSSFLRGLAWQAASGGAQVLLADRHRTTFPMFRGHGALRHDIAARPDEYVEVVEAALAELEIRARWYNSLESTGQYPETLDEYNRMTDEPLPRLVVILDEFSVTAKSDKRLTGIVDHLVSEGLKFGVQVVLAAQDFSKDALGALRDQMRTVVAFKVANVATARNLGVERAYALGAPGRAITNQWGVVQTYYTDKARLIAGLRGDGESAPVPLLTEDEQTIIAAALGSGGRVTRQMLMDEIGLSRHAASTLQHDWEARGWIEKRPDAANAYHLTEKVVKLAESSCNRTTAATACNPLQPAYNRRAAAVQPPVADLQPVAA